MSPKMSRRKWRPLCRLCMRFDRRWLDTPQKGPSTPQNGHFSDGCIAVINDGPQRKPCGKCVKSLKDSESGTAQLRFVIHPGHDRFLSVGHPR